MESKWENYHIITFTGLTLSKNRETIYMRDPSPGDKTEDGRCACEIKSRFAMAKAAYNKKKNLFTSKLGLNLRKKLVKCCVWSMAVYGAETWTLRATEQ